MSKTVVALYNELATAEQVVRSLVANGFERDTISLLAHDATRGTTEGRLAGSEAPGMPERPDAGKLVGIGAAFGGLAGLVAGLVALALPGVGPIVAAGPLAAGLASIGVGAVTGGVLAVLAEIGLPESQAQIYAEGLRRGGTLVAMGPEDDQRANLAREIMSQHHPLTVETVSGPRPAGAIPDDGSDLARQAAAEQPGASRPRSAAETGVMVTAPRPEASEERLDLGLPDSMGAPVMAGGDATLSGQDAGPAADETTPASEGVDLGAGENAGTRTDINTPADMGAQYWEQGAGEASDDEQRAR